MNKFMEQAEINMCKVLHTSSRISNNGYCRVYNKHILFGTDIIKNFNDITKLHIFNSILKDNQRLYLFVTDWHDFPYYKLLEKIIERKIHSRIMFYIPNELDIKFIKRTISELIERLHLKENKLINVSIHIFNKPIYFEYEYCRMFKVFHINNMLCGMVLPRDYPMYLEDWNKFENDKMRILRFIKSRYPFDILKRYDSDREFWEYLRNVLPRYIINTYKDSYSDGKLCSTDDFGKLKEFKSNSPISILTQFNSIEDVLKFLDEKPVNPKKHTIDLEKVKEGIHHVLVDELKKSGFDTSKVENDENINKN